ncbi:MAG: phosphoribosyl-AMP cyclohydrolase [Candidatus Hydrogenedentes bacterium]|nr:phosphoribosyl-AMP cyclohydrolase [Candidatus Hydrogenedentota bacterium]
MPVFDEVKFDQTGLIPAIIQDADNLELLMLAYMNEESLRLTLETGETHFWSRSRQCLWHKGETSGNIQEVREIRLDCDSDTLLIKVVQRGKACHTGRRSCFHRRIDRRTGSIQHIEE